MQNLGLNILTASQRLDLEVYWSKWSVRLAAATKSKYKVGLSAVRCKCHAVPGTQTLLTLMVAMFGLCCSFV